MSFGKTIPLYCITFLVLWLGGSVRLTESLEVIRGYHDKFPNSHSNCKSVSSGQHASVCSNFCSNMDGKCENPSDCTYCVCGVEGKNTYMNPTGGCVTDEKVVPESVPRDRFMIQDDHYFSCAVLDTSTSRVRGATCPPPFVENVPMLWKWTIGNQLMNIKTLECIQALNTGEQIIMKPCNLTSKKQTLSCQNCMGNPPRSCTLRIHNNLYLKLPRKENNMVSTKSNNQRWTSYRKYSMPVCSTPTKYDGCYRFLDGSFLRLLNLSACQDDKHCLTQEISAPIFKHNINCEIKWEESEYIQNEDSWKPVHGRKQFLSLVVKSNTRGIQLDISNDDVLEEWNGSLLKLQINCSNKLVNDDNRPSEQHCVLLKFATLPDQQDESTTLVPPENTQEPSIFPTITINPTSSEQWYFTNVKTSASPSPTDSKSKLSGRSSSSKVVAISVSVVALVLILLLVFGFIVFYRRRKRVQEQRANSEEMTSRGEQKPQVIYDEPSQYEPLKDDRGEASGEHYYKGLIATTPPGDTMQEMISRGEQNPQEVVYEEPSQTYEPLKDERGEASGEHYYKGLIATTPLGDTMQEMTSRKEQNPKKVIYEEPSQTYEPLKDERGEASGEHYYKGLIATTPLGEPPQGTTNEAQIYEPLKDERGEASGEHYYKGLIATTPLGELQQCTTDDAQIYEPLKEERGEASGEHYYKGLIATTPLGEPPRGSYN